MWKFVSIYLFVLNGFWAYELKNVELPDNINDLTIFSDTEISEFNGSDGKPVYIAVKGVVFDVSSGANFYGPGKAYNALAGKDCSRAVAKMSLEPEDLTHDLTGLSDAFLQSLDKTYEGVYLAKYPIVGYMDYLVERKKTDHNVEL